MRRSLLLLALLILPAACMRTEFHGRPHFPGGPGACQTKCQKEGLDMSGFVYSGEFSSSCVCRAPGGPPPPDTNAELDAADAASSAGVVMQMRRDEEERQNNNR